jgi:transcription elongation factor Elf1
MDLVDSKYIGLVSSRLQKFKRVKDNLYTFRCPICGDSQKNKNKTRGYIYQVKNNTNFKCHNCGASFSFNNFLKEIDVNLHKQYTLEKFKEGHTGRNFVVEAPKFEFTKPVFKKSINLPKASTNTFAREYLVKRRIDPDKFYYADKFMQWTNTQKQTFDNIKKDENRIVIPMYDRSKNLIGFQGRALGKSYTKYITVMLNEESPKIYGLEKVDSTEPIYIVEGPFDSTFIQNAVAMCGSDVDIGSFNWSNYIYVFDNEPRNREIVNRIFKTIDRGNKVVIWPNNIIEKDINDMFVSGHDVMSVVKLNTYSGLEAKIKFNNWKKI